MSQNNQIGSPKAGLVNSNRRGIFVLAQQKITVNLQEYQRLKRERDQLLNFLDNLILPQQGIQQKMKQPSIFKEEETVKKIEALYQKVINFQKLNRLFQLAKKWQNPLIDKLIGTSIPTKNHNQFIISAMSNQLKMAHCLLFNRVNHAQYISINYFSTQGVKMFQRIEQLIHYQDIIHDLDDYIHGQLLPSLKMDNIIADEEYKRIEKLKIIQLFKETIIKFFQNNNRINQNISQLNKQKQELFQQKQKYRTQALQAYQSNNKLADQLFRIEKTKNSLDNINNAQKQQHIFDIKMLKEELEKSKKSKDTLFNKMREVQIKNQKLTQQLEKTCVLINNKQERIQRYQQTQRQLTEQMNSLKEKQKEEWQRSNQSFLQKQKISQLQYKIKNLQTQKSQLMNVNASTIYKDSIIKRQQAEISKLTKDLLNINQIKQKLQKTNKKQNQDFQSLQNQYNAVYNALQQRDQMEENKRQISNTIQEKQAQIRQLKLNHQKYFQISVNNTNKLNQTIKKLQKNLNQLKYQNEKLQSQIGKNNKKANNNLMRFNTLFQNEVLDDYIQHKQYLAQTIEQFMRMRIIKTRLIYSYDPYNRVNFHKYIDGVDNIVAIIKMKNGTFTAGYSQGSFQPNKISDREGLIISISKKKIFNLVQRNRRAISYDEYYIIFGNSQIRIRSQDTTIFSNFGISNSYYASRNEKVNVILGGTPQDRELQFQHYQFYQLIFDN